MADSVSCKGLRERKCMHTWPSAVIGSWCWDAASDRARSDRFVARLFDVDPEETLVGMARRQFIETGAILATDVAPGGAQTGDDPDVIRQRFGQLGAIMEFYSNTGHRYILPQCI